MSRRLTLVLLFVAWASMSMPCHGAPAPPLSQTFTFDRPGVLYVTPTGQNAYTQVATQSPATIPLDPGGEYDLLVEGPDGFFLLWRGEYQRYHPASSIKATPITLHRVVAWSHVAAAGVGGLALVGALLFFRLRGARKEQQTLAEQLEEEQAYSELRPGALPKKVGRYKIEDRLGTGGMATVYRAVDEYGDTYALKVPDLRVLDHEDSAARFFREMEISGALKHPGIVRIAEVHRGDDKTHPYIALEFIDGETLRQLIDREGPLPVDRTLAIVREIADALEYAHSKSIIHRDLKPANIMITRRQQIRIMDFGIAKATNLETMTGTDITLGTPDYMAPEQVDSRGASVQSDLYSLGIMLFEMMAKQLPFEDTDAYRLLVRKMNDPAPRLSTLRPDVPKRLDNLIALLLSTDPARRPKSAAELVRLIDLLEG